MSIYQFNSGHVVSAASMGHVRPVFKVTLDTQLSVTAGDAALDSADPSIALSTRTSVQVNWYHATSSEVAPAEGGRRRRGQAEDATGGYRGMLVGRAIADVADSASSLILSKKFEKLANFRTKDKRDAQTRVMQYVKSIEQIHGQIRARSIEGFDAGVIDPTKPDPSVLLETRVTGFQRVLEEYEVTGIEDLVGEFEGVYELNDALEKFGISVDQSVLEALLVPPFIDLGGDDASASEIDYDQPDADPEPIPSGTTSESQAKGAGGRKPTVVKEHQQSAT